MLTAMLFLLCCVFFSHLFCFFQYYIYCRIGWSPSIPVHIVVACMECALEGPLTVLKHDEVKFLFYGCRSIVVLKKVRAIFQSSWFFEEAVFLKALHCRYCLCIEVVNILDNLVCCLEEVVDIALAVALIASYFHFTSEFVEFFRTSCYPSLHYSLNKSLCRLKICVKHSCCLKDKSPVKCPLRVVINIYKVAGRQC